MTDIKTDITANDQINDAAGEIAAIIQAHWDEHNLSAEEREKILTAIEEKILLSKEQ